MKILFIVVVCLILVGLVLMWWLDGFKKIWVQNPLTATIAPSPMPLAELTIPYLRAREYKSTISAQKEISQNGSYTSYVATYNSDGLAINGLLTKPVGQVPVGGFPAIVFVHGYIPPTIYETNGAPYSAYVDYFARAGFVVFKIDLRGHDKSEGMPGGGYFGSDYVVDTLNARAALQSSDFVNPEKIGLWGHSMAGNTLLRAFVARPEVPAVAIWAGAVYSYADMQTYGLNDNSYRPPVTTGTPNASQNARRRITELYGNFSTASAFWKQVAPTNYVGDLNGAIQIHHAVDDPVVNVGYSRDLMKILDERSKAPHELFEYESGGHNISGVSFNLAMQRTVAFFKKYLDPGFRPSPE